jgi:hypothetical protein
MTTLFTDFRLALAGLGKWPATEQHDAYEFLQVLLNNMMYVPCISILGLHAYNEA